MKYKKIMMLLLLCPFTAYAYIGPGMGAGAIATVLGLIGSVFLILLAILYYPIKRIIKKRKNNIEISDEKKNK